MIPLGAFVTTHETTGPERTAHYNGLLTAEINGGPSPGRSTRGGQKALETIVNRDPPDGMGFEWAELTYHQIPPGHPPRFPFPPLLPPPLPRLSPPPPP